MTPTTSFSIVEVPNDGFDGIRFQLLVTRSDKRTIYQGKADRNALLNIAQRERLSGSNEQIFDAIRTKIEGRAAKLWNDKGGQPNTAKFVIDASNFEEFGTFVNNG